MSHILLFLLGVCIGLAMLGRVRNHLPTIWLAFWLSLVTLIAVVVLTLGDFV